MPLEKYQTQIEKAKQIYNTVMKNEYDSYDKQWEKSHTKVKPTITQIKNKILNDYKDINIEFGDMLGGRGDDDYDIEKIGSARVLWDLLKNFKLTDGLNPPPNHPAAYTKWTAETGIVKLEDDGHYY
jgi:hypothetical protein